VESDENEVIVSDEDDDFQSPPPLRLVVFGAGLIVESTSCGPEGDIDNTKFFG
jgi:hypothetical protein